MSMLSSGKRTGAIAVATAMLLVTSASAADGDRASTRSNSVTHRIRIEVLPFAEVRLDTGQLTVKLPAKGGNSKPIIVGGTITTNVPATLAVEMTPPPGAPRTTEWEARALVDHVDRPGVHRFDRLLRIQAFKKGPRRFVAEQYSLALFTGLAELAGPYPTRVRVRGPAPPVAHPPSGPAGTVMLLIMPHP